MPQTRRQLAAILFTDIIGYTRMMQDDEKHAVVLCHRYTSVMKECVAVHEGEILNDYGDGNLCSFSSATAAVQCAMELQQKMQHEPSVPLRIGLHIGEIFIEDGKIFGDGVNIASRIQSLGVANSILYSSEINSKLKNQEGFKSVSLGRFRFKNVEELHEVFALANPGFLVPMRKSLEGKLEVKKSNKWLYGGIALVLLLAGAFMAYRILSKSSGFSGKEKSIAVLPFDNIGLDSEEYISDGITQDIINNLSKVSSLQKVIGWFSVRSFKKTTKTTHQIAEELGVAALLTGTIQRQSGKLRIIAELIDANNNKRIWGHEYNYDDADILSIQSNLATTIVAELQASLTPEERRGLTKHYTDNVEAYKLYRKGRVFWDQRTKASYDSAESYYKRAIDLDPEYALAYVGLADCYTFNQKGLLQIDAIPIARDYAAKALSLDSTLTEAWTTIAFIKSHYDLNFAEADTLFQKIIRKDPNYAIAHVYYGNLLLNTGETERGLAETRKALSLDPLSAVINYVLGRNLFFARKYDSAVAQLKKNLTLNPKFLNSYIPLGQAYVQLKQYDKAIDAFSRLPKVPFDQGSHGLLFLSFANAAAGNMESAKALLTKVPEVDQISCAYFASWPYAAIGDKESAIKYLRIAREQHAIPLFGLMVDPDLDPLRSDPRYQSMVKELFKKPLTTGK